MYNKRFYTLVVIIKFSLELVIFVSLLRKICRRHSRRLLNVVCTFNLRPVTRRKSGSHVLFCSVFISSNVKVYLGPRQTSMMKFFVKIINFKSLLIFAKKLHHRCFQSPKYAFFMYHMISS